MNAYLATQTRQCIEGENDSTFTFGFERVDGDFQVLLVLNNKDAHIEGNIVEEIVNLLKSRVDEEIVVLKRDDTLLDYIDKDELVESETFERS